MNNAAPRRTASFGASATVGDDRYKTDPSILRTAYFKFLSNNFVRPDLRAKIVLGGGVIRGF